MIVCVGVEVKDLKDWIKKEATKESKADLLKWAGENSDFFDRVSEGKQLGYAICHSEKNYLIMILQKYKDDWSYWECLVHELSHILDWIVEWKMLQGESEARAYLHEWLFREIRRKIQLKDSP